MVRGWCGTFRLYGSARPVGLWPHSEAVGRARHSGRARPTERRWGAPGTAVAPDRPAEGHMWQGCSAIDTLPSTFIAAAMLFRACKGM